MARRDQYPCSSNETHTNWLGLLLDSSIRLVTGRGSSGVYHCNSWGRWYYCKKFQFILYLDNGTLFLYKSASEVYLIASGLEGEYVWFVSSNGPRRHYCEVKIGEWE